MRNGVPFFAVLAACLAASVARAGDEVAPHKSFSLDTVFVSRFKPDDAESTTDAERIRTFLEQRLASQFILIARQDVPPFEDYTAEVYLQSCPPDQFFGCAFVIGGRAGAEWVIAGDVGEPLDSEAGKLVTVAFINVSDSRVVFSFQAQWSPETQSAFGDAVAQILDQIVQGAAIEQDIREESPEDKEKREQAAQEALRQSLTAMEGELGAMAETTPLGRLEDPKLTEADLAKYRGTEEASPWQRLDMSESQYLRFRNSGRPLNDWRALERGRMARVVLSGSIGTAVGPWSETFDGRIGLDHDTLQPIQVDEWQEVRPGSGLLVDLEAGFGIARWFTISASVAPRSGSYNYLFFRQVEGQDPDPVPAYTSRLLQTVQFAGRLEFAPMSTWPYRPTATVGLASWKGSTIQSVVELPQKVEPLDAPTQIFLEIGPGAEVDAGKVISLFARGLLELPVAGRKLSEFSDGQAVITAVADPEGRYGAGFEVSGGVKLRIGPLWESKAHIPTSNDEDEEVP